MIIDAIASAHYKNKWQYHHHNITYIQDTATVLRTTWNKISPFHFLDIVEGLEPSQETK
jgi:hypothetical protein